MAFPAIFVFLLLGALINTVAASRHHNHLHNLQLDVSTEVWHKESGKKLPPLNTTYYFDQLIDHDDPSLGTFKQRYWFGYQYYKPGGPIIVYNPGEGDASGSVPFLTNLTITGVMAEQYNAAIVVFEHRFFGESNPYPDLSTASFRVHTLEQSIADLEYFATTAELPMPGGDKVSAPGNAPWIMVGGSYAGALTSFTMHRNPGLFYAGYSSSGVVEALADFWGYFEPIREAMPKNCSADVEVTMNYIDDVLATGNATAIKAMKDIFGMGGLKHDDDFADRLGGIIQLWQELQPYTGPGGSFYQFCDALEVRDDGRIAGPNGWGLDYALSAWGSVMKDYVNNTCAGFDIEACLGTYNPKASEFTSITVNNWERSWQWLLCNHFGFWFDGAPQGRPTLSSRHVTPAYGERQCASFFPEAFNKTKPISFLNALDVNMKYGGWNVTTERLVFVNGIRDPWREATMAATGVTNTGSELQPHLLGDGFHCSDMTMVNGQLSESIGAAQQKALEYIGKWLADWMPPSA